MLKFLMLKYILYLNKTIIKKGIVIFMKKKIIKCLIITSALTSCLLFANTHTSSADSSSQSKEVPNKLGAHIEIDENNIEYTVHSNGSVTSHIKANENNKDFEDGNITYGYPTGSYTYSDSQ